jgi:uncharacterized protein (DUF362 family)
MRTTSFDRLPCFNNCDRTNTASFRANGRDGQAAQAISRRDFLKAGVGAAIAAGPGLAALTAWADATPPVVSIVRIVNDNVEAAVEQAIDLLGGMASLTQGKNRILLKPNLVAPGVNYTTKPAVIRALARLMQAAGKEVLIGEGSAAASGFNVRNGTTYLTRCEDILNGMQQYVFDQLGYTALAQSLGVPLVNLHTGEMVTVPVPGGLFWKEIVLPRALVDCDLVVSVPMMKTHACATVTLGLKNVIGLYPGAIYGSARWWIHGNTAAVSPGVAFEILDMVRVNKMGLTVIDGYWAMEGNGPTGGSLVKMNLIIAGTSPLATDMVGAAVMGFTNLEAIPTFAWAHTLGMSPASLGEIEVRGEAIANVQRNFVRPNLITCPGGVEIYPAPKPELSITADGKGVVSWDEAILRPILQTAQDGKKYVTWTNTAAGSPSSILEQNPVLQKTGWVRRYPQSPRRYEFDASQATNSFFRLRKLY